jgi:hypothetical protein
MCIQVCYFSFFLTIFLCKRYIQRGNFILEKKKTIVVIAWLERKRVKLGIYEKK